MNDDERAYLRRRAEECKAGGLMVVEEADDFISLLDWGEGLLLECMRLEEKSGIAEIALEELRAQMRCDLFGRIE